MYNDGADDAEDRYSLQQPALPEPDYDAGAAFDYGSNIDSSPMEYDYAMEELLRQLPSRQLGMHWQFRITYEIGHIISVLIYNLLVT